MCQPRPHVTEEEREMTFRRKGYKEGTQSSKDMVVERWCPNNGDTDCQEQPPTPSPSAGRAGEKLFTTLKDNMIV